MSHTSSIAVLWDASHTWGLMALRALRVLDFPIRLLKGTEIAHGALFRKQGGIREDLPLLLVPGGPARIKAKELGDAGMAAIRDYVAAGGNYLGFCGGAGLALSHTFGLGLCPWKRQAYPERLLHLISGHVLSCPEPNAFTPDWGVHQPSLPIWWPGRFSNSGGDVEVLARGRKPDTDFWIADIPLQSVPRRVFTQWEANYGINLTGDFLDGTELMVHGAFGRGQYVLSYSHLETPNSPDANRWLAHVLALLTATDVDPVILPPWELMHPRARCGSCPPQICTAANDMRALMELAIEHRLFFRRTCWLTGWKPSLPGSVCNSLMTALGEAEKTDATPTAIAWWAGRSEEFSRLCAAFFPGAEAYLLAVRLEETLLPTMPRSVDRERLDRERDRLFGHPMNGGGVLGALLGMVEEYLFLCWHDEGLRDAA